MKTAAQTRRDYQRGYSAGLRNRALALTGAAGNRDFVRGWGAGQARLHVKVGAWPKKRKRGSRRRVFYVWPAHLKSGGILYLDHRKLGRAMVRVRVTKI